MKTLSLSKTIAVSLGALIVLLAVVFTLKAETPILNLKGGSKLVYSMQSASVTSDATVILNTLAPTVSFKWKTSETVYGKVIFSTESFNSGRMISSKLIEDQKGDYGFFWISKVMFTELSAGKTSFNLNGNEKTEGVVKAGIEQMEVRVNGAMKSIDVIHAKSVTPGGGVDFYVLNDVNNPLIIKMTTTAGGFSLKEITE